MSALSGTSLSFLLQPISDGRQRNAATDTAHRENIEKHPDIPLPELTGERLFDVVRAWSLSAGGFDVWGWNDFRALPVGWFEGLAAILA